MADVDTVPEGIPLQFWAQHDGDNTARYELLIDGEVRLAAKGPADLVDMNGAPAITFDHPGVPDGRYAWEIKAYNDAGEAVGTGPKVLVVSQGLPALFGLSGVLIVSGR